MDRQSRKKFSSNLKKERKKVKQIKGRTERQKERKGKKTNFESVLERNKEQRE